jgi:hypothetical protein
MSSVIGLIPTVSYITVAAEDCKLSRWPRRQCGNHFLFAHLQHPAGKLAKSVILSGVPKPSWGNCAHDFKSSGLNSAAGQGSLIHLFLFQAMKIFTRLTEGIFSISLHISHKLCTVTELAAARFFSCFFAFYSPMIDSHLGLRSIGLF